MVTKRSSTGSALKYLRGHNADVDRYLARYYYNYDDRKMIKYFFYEHATQAQVIIKDYCTPEERKKEWITELVYYGKSKIIIIVGARGAGKTGLCMYLSDELHKIGQNRLYFVGEDIDQNLFPEWIKVVPDIGKVPDGNVAIVDEAGLKYSARRFMQDENVLLTGLIATARHHDLTIIFITQHLSLVDINIFKMRDIVFYLKSSDYSIGERSGKINKEDKRYGLIRDMMQPRDQGECLFEMPSSRRFISFEFELPEFWNDNISKLFKGYNAKEHLVQEKAKRIKEQINNRLDYIRQKEEIKASIYASKGIKTIKEESSNRDNEDDIPTWD